MPGRAPPAFVEPQLATRAKAPPDGPGWIHELKLDGYRIQARLAGGRATLASRRGHAWTDALPTLAAAIAALPARDAVLDGEAVVLIADGTTSFQALQAALGGRPPGGALAYVAFDLLWLDGEDLRPRPLDDRKARLRALLDGLPAGAPLRFSEHIEGRGPEVLRQVCAQRGLEGVISKRRDRPYASGRGTDWIKTKCTERQELVVGGFTEARTGGGALGALLLGVHEEGGLAYAGKVGTGFTAAGARELRARLDRLARATSPFARGGPTGADARAACWVRPEVVVEVEFTEWTSDGRLRHPVFHGVRVDRAAAEVVRERPAPAPIDTPPPPRPPSRRAGTRRAALPGARQRGRPRR